MRISSLDKHIAGCRAFDRLSPEEQAEIEALNMHDRTVLFDMWQPTDSEAIDALSTDLVRLVYAVHDKGLPITATVRCNGDKTRVLFSRNAKVKVNVGGFDRSGKSSDKKFDAAEIAQSVTNELMEAAPA